jgi:regulator of protease activity HflC (stomatin/prohibitin superfamily)
MAWLVGTILLLIAAGLAFAVATFAPSRVQVAGGGADGAAKLHPTRFWALVAGSALVLGWIILTFAESIYIIPAGHIGVVYGFGGGSIVGHRDSGTTLVAPWREVKVASVQLKSVIFDYTGDNAAVSKDQQAVNARVQVNYQLDPTKVVDLYRNVGPGWFNVLMEGRVAQDFKQVTSSFATTDITTHRPELRAKTLAAIKNELAKYSVTIADVQIKNLHFNKRYSDAITDKQVAYQHAQAAIQNANAAVNTAKGEATATLVKAEAQAKANKLLAQNLPPNLVAYQYVQKLAPNVKAIVLSGTSAGVFLPQGFLEGETSTPPRTGK